MKKALISLFLLLFFVPLAGALDDGVTSKADILNVLWLPAGAELPAALPKDAKPATLGKNMVAFLNALEKKKLPLVQRYPERYAFFKELSSKGLTARQAYNLADLLGEDYFYGFGQVADDAKLTFPADHQPHLNYQTGWYFFVGNFKDKKGVPYGILCMFFRRALFPPEIAKQLGLSEIDNQFVDVQFAVTMGDKKINLQGHNALIAGSSGLVKYNTDPFLAQVGHNVCRSLQKGKLFPMKIHFKDPDIPLEADLLLTESQPILLQGDQGKAPAVYGLGTLYYSIPGIKAAGTLTYKKARKELTGIMWMDNQWTAGIMPPGYPVKPYIQALANTLNGLKGKANEGWGWDWTEVQFTDGSGVTFSGIHSTISAELKNRGPIPPGKVTRPLAGGKYFNRNGEATPVSGEVTLTRWVLSPASRAWYPCGWAVSIPALKLKFTMTPLVDDQLLHFANASEYKEGAVTVKGSKDGKPIAGVGFGEAVAYAGEDYYYKTKLRLVGIKDTPANRALLMPKTPGPWLLVKSVVFLAGLPVIGLLLLTAVIIYFRQKRKTG